MHTEAQQEWNRRKRELQREGDYLKVELEKRELEAAELKDKLRKREEEIREYKVSLQSQVSTVDQEYRRKVDELLALSRGLSE